MGVALAEPPKLNFLDPRKAEKVGRRKKIGHSSLLSKPADNHNEDRHHSRHRHKRRKIDTTASPSLDIADMSVRWGSNIHQSQATSTMQPSRIPMPSPIRFKKASSESMLLDKEIVLIDTGPSAHAAEEDAGKQYKELSDGVNGISLIPLDRVRDCVSFDEVKAHSVSSSWARITSDRRSSGQANVAALSSSIILGNRILDSSGSAAPTTDLFQAEKARKSTDSPSLRSLRRYQTQDEAETTKIHKSPHMVHLMPLQGGDINVRPKAPAPRDLKMATPRSQIAPDLPFSFEILSTRNRSRYNSRVAAVPRTPPRRFTIDQQAEEASEKFCHTRTKQQRRGAKSPRSHLFEQSRLKCDNRSCRALNSRHPQERDSMGSAIDDHENHPRLRSGPAAGTQSERTSQYGRFSRDRKRLPDSIENTAEVLPRDHHDVSSIEMAGQRSGDLTIGQNYMDKENVGRSVNELRAANSTENEAWMKHIFKDDFSKMQQDFRYSPARGRGPLAEPAHLAADSPKTLASAQRSEFVDPTTSPSRTFLTDRNAAMYHTCPRLEASTNETETDFLSRFSPMQGVLDENLENLSFYNNAAKSIRSFIPAPSHISKRLNFTSRSHQAHVYDEIARPQLYKKRSFENVMSRDREDDGFKEGKLMLYVDNKLSRPSHRQVCRIDTDSNNVPLWRPRQPPKQMQSFVNLPQHPPNEASANTIIQRPHHDIFVPTRPRLPAASQQR